MRVRAFVPVQEAFSVESRSGGQLFNCLVDIAVLVAKCGLNRELIDLAIETDVEVQVIALLAGAVIVVKEGGLVAVRILAGSQLKALERDLLVHFINQLVLAEKLCHILRFRDECVAVEHFEGRVSDLDFAGPLSLVAGDLDLLAFGKCIVLFFCAGHCIDEVSAVLRLGIDGSRAVHKCLLSLDISLNADLGVDISRCELFKAHHGNFFLSCGALGSRLGLRSCALDH